MRVSRCLGLAIFVNGLPALRALLVPLNGDRQSSPIQGRSQERSLTTCSAKKDDKDLFFSPQRVRPRRPRVNTARHATKPSNLLFAEPATKSRPRRRRGIPVLRRFKDVDEELALAELPVKPHHKRRFSLPRRSGPSSEDNVENGVIVHDSSADNNSRARAVAFQATRSVVWLLAFLTAMPKVVQGAFYQTTWLDTPLLQTAGLAILVFFTFSALVARIESHEPTTRRKRRKSAPLISQKEFQSLSEQVKHLERLRKGPVPPAEGEKSWDAYYAEYLKKPGVVDTSVTRPVESVKPAVGKLPPTESVPLSAEKPPPSKMARAAAKQSISAPPLKKPTEEQPKSYPGIGMLQRATLNVLSRPKSAADSESDTPMKTEPKQSAQVLGKQVSSYAPTKPSVKGRSSASPGSYVNTLKPGVEPTKSYQPEARTSKQVKSDTPTQPNGKSTDSTSSEGYWDNLKELDTLLAPIEPKVTTGPAVETPVTTKRNVGSYAPTQSGVKDLSSSSGGYLDALRDSPAKGRISDENTQMITTFRPVSARRSVSSYAPTKPSVKNLSSSSSVRYLDNMTDMQNRFSQPLVRPDKAVHASAPGDAGSSSQRVVSSYAPTKPSVKSVVSASPKGYLDILKDGGLAEPKSYSDTEISRNVQPVEEPPIVPGRQEVSVRGSYAPTKSTVKNLSSSSSSSYLNVITMGGPIEPMSYQSVAGDDLEAASVDSSQTVPVLTFDRDEGTKRSGPYAPTKPGVKYVPSTSSSSYLNELSVKAGVKSNIKDTTPTEMESYAIVDKTEPNGAGEAFTEPPMSPSTVDNSGTVRPEAIVSYAPTKPEATNLSSSPSSGYLDTIKAGVSMITSWYASVGETTTAVEPERFDTASMADVRAVHKTIGSYAPTKPSVKDVQSSSSSVYLNNLKPTVSFEPRSSPVAEDAIDAYPEVETAVPVDTISESRKVLTYAPTKPGVKNLSSTSSGAYLDDLKGASPVESKSYPAGSDSGAVDAVDESKATKRADAQHEVKVSYAPTKPGVKNLSSSSSSGYLNTFKPMNSSSIASLERDAAVERETVETVIPVRPSDFPRRGTSYAPTKPGVKDVQSSSSSSYLNVLQPGVSMESRSYPATSDATVSDSAVETVVPVDTRATGSNSRKVLSYAPTQPRVKNLSSTSSGAYLDDLKGASPMESKSYPVTRESGAMDTVDESVSTEPPTTEGADARQEIKVSYAPTKTGVKNLSSSSSSGYLNTIKPMESSSSASRRFTSYAPTKPGVKDVQSSSSSGYLNDLQPGVSMESRSYPATSDATVSGSAVETVVPVDTGATGSVSQKLSSYAPTKPGVRNLSSTSSGAYLDDLKGASPMESKSYPAASDSGAVDAVDESKATKRADAQHEVKVSYAPTKPGVKNLSSSSSSGYLNTFKPMYSSSIASLERDAAVERETVETVIPVRPSDFPRRVTSYAPTKPGVKDVQSSSSSSYLNVLQPGVSMESRSYPATSDATVSDSAVETVVPVDTRATGSNSRKVLSYAPTKPRVKNLSSTSSGAYLDDLKGASPMESKSYPVTRESGAMDTVDESVSTEPPTTEGADARQEIKVSYAPTKTGVKNLSSSSSSGYLNTIKPMESSSSASRRFTSYAPTKPGVKDVQSSSSSGYLNDLQPGVSMESRSYPATSDATVSGSAVETVVPVDTGATGSVSQKLSSYAPTKPGVRNLSSTSSGAYLDDLKGASPMESKSYPAASDSGAVDAVDESKATKRADAQHEVKVSYAPTKPGVKNLSSSSSSGYLNTFKPMYSSSIASLERDAAVERETVETVLPVRPSDVPRRVTSYAPTKPGVKDVQSSSSSSYLNVLQPGVSMESRFYPATSDATVSDSAVETVVSMDTRATGSKSRKVLSYAPTQPGVKNLSSTSSGAYLDDLKGASPMESKSYPVTRESGAMDTVDESVSTEPPTTEGADARQEIKVSYAPTKTGVKNLSSFVVEWLLEHNQADGVLV